MLPASGDKPLENIDILHFDAITVPRCRPSRWH
jgi:hypothetical protein